MGVIMREITIKPVDVKEDKDALDILYHPWGCLFACKTEKKVHKFFDGEIEVDENYFGEPNRRPRT